MSLRSRPLTQLAILGALATACLLGLAYAGRDRLFEAWHLHRLSSADRATSESAARELVELDSARAVPPLLALALGERTEGRRSSPWERALLDLGETALPAIAESFARVTPESRDLLTRLVRKLPADARAALPLASLLSEPAAAALAPQVGATLAVLGPEADDAVPLVLRALRSTEAASRRAALMAIRGILPAARTPASSIVALLEDESGKVRADAAFTLGHAVRADADLLTEELKEALEGLLSDPDASVARYARWALPALSPPEEDTP